MNNDIKEHSSSKSYNPDSKNQETSGFLSPFLREQRLKQIAKCLRPNDVILDLASGTGFLRNHIGPTCKYFGVDKLPPAIPKNFDLFLELYLILPDAFKKIIECLPKKPTVITLIAFLEHFKTPKNFLEKCVSLGKKWIRVVGTTPHPRGRRLHNTLARFGIYSEEATKEHETFLDKSYLKEIGVKSRLPLAGYSQFLFGLNQLFVYGNSR